jgi:hypothetical protein
VEVERISAVSKVYSGLKMAVAAIKITRYKAQKENMKLSYIFFCLFHPMAE